MLINYFDGQQIPGGPKSVDGVLFLSILHHAANHTSSLLRSANTVARKAILVLEDLEIPGDERLSARNRQHEPNGIFRTDTQWKRMFRTHLTSFVLLGSDLVRQRAPSVRVPVKGGKPLGTSHLLMPSNNVVTLTPSTGAIRNEAQRWWLLGRRSERPAIDD